MKVPAEQRWLFWELDVAELDVEAHADQILARVLEQGRLIDVRWLIATYGYDRIHTFFKEKGHPELSARTRAFWRAVFNADEEPWAEPPSWRKSSAVPWPP